LIRAPLAPLLALALCIGAVAAPGCGAGSSTQAGGVTIEPLTSTPAPDTIVGGKPDRPVTAGASPAAVSNGATTAGAATETSAPEPSSVAGPDAPSEGRWIDVDVTKLVVRLMDGRNAVREIAPVAVGEQIDTGAYASTQTGLFRVYDKVEGLAYDPPYDTYISHWVGFDPDKANGFHSFLKDKDGNVVDAATGRVSNGCIRTGAAEAIFAFAEIGMAVVVHT